MTQDAGASLRLTRTIPAEPDAVFRAWTDPDRMKRWLCPEGAVVETAEADLRVGGTYRIVMRTPDDAVHTARGEYREIDRPGRLVFTWGWEEEGAGVEPGGSVVTLELLDREGSTEVVLLHERLPSAESRDGHESGWIGCLDHLEALFD